MSDRSARILMLLGLAPAAIVAALALLAVPNFKSMYASFDAALPLATRVLFSSYPLYVALPIGVLVIWFAWPSRPDRGRAAVIFGILGSGLLFCFGAWAAYMPLFNLARG